MASKTVEPWVPNEVLVAYGDVLGPKCDVVPLPGSNSIWQIRSTQRSTQGIWLLFRHPCGWMTEKRIGELADFFAEVEELFPSLVPIPVANSARTWVTTSIDHSWFLTRANTGYKTKTSEPPDETITGVVARALAKVHAVSIQQARRQCHKPIGEEGLWHVEDTKIQFAGLQARLTGATDTAIGDICNVNPILRLRALFPYRAMEPSLTASIQATVENSRLSRMPMANRFGPQSAYDLGDRMSETFCSLHAGLREMELPPTNVHGSFRMANFLWRRTEPLIYDWPRLRLGFPLWDVAHFAVSAFTNWGQKSCPVEVGQSRVFNFGRFHEFISAYRAGVSASAGEIGLPLEAFSQALIRDDALLRWFMLAVCYRRMAELLDPNQGNGAERWLKLQNVLHLERALWAEKCLAARRATGARPYQASTPG